MKRKLVSRALPSVLVAGGLLVTGGMSATAADGAPSSVEQSAGGLGDVLSGTVDAVVGKGGAVDSTLGQVTDTVEQVTKKEGAVDDTVKGVTGAVDAVAGRDGAVDDVVRGVTGGEAKAPTAKGGPVDDVVRGVSGVVTSVAGEDGAVDDVLGADEPERGLTDNLPNEIIDDVGSIGENLGRGDVPGTIGAVTGENGVVDDLLESPVHGGPGGGDPGDGGPGGPGGPGDGPGSGDGSGTIPVSNLPGLGTGVDTGLPIQSIGEAQAPGALAQTGFQVAGAAAVALGLTAAGAAMVRARRRMLETQD
ncbi:hypothetical protein [Promicromonospora sukumoe]|uniref:hypothetical protein n=1 Tax=Promicromonospora sukumoe TaxID=88382 RepID=UPI0004784E86|nr:hypothetical protein [Promicromonospora sukumoe]